MLREQVVSRFSQAVIAFVSVHTPPNFYLPRER